jgi:putative ABC transport system permease protein
MRQAIRYRRNQAVVIALLSSLVVACVTFAPMYDRALLQALAWSRLAREPVDVTGIRLSATNDPSPSYGWSVSPGDLAARIPPQMLAHFQGRIDSRGVDVAVATPRLAGPLLWRTDVCRHLRFSAGTCPARSDEIAVSPADAARFGWNPGSTVTATEDVEAGTGLPLHARTFTVTGVYDVIAGPYWFGSSIVGRSGHRDRDSAAREFDDWITSEATFSGGWLEPTSGVDLRLSTDGTGFDELLELGSEVRAVRAELTTPTAAGTAPPSIQLTTGLEDIADDLARGREQAHVTIPLLMVQLGLFALVVLWLVVRAAVDQRRPELALARLRGRTPWGAALLLLRELGTPVAAGVPAGLALAWGISALVRRTWLPGAVPFEVTAALVWAALAGALALLLALTPILGVVRQPISALLRQVAPRASRRAVGSGEAVVVAVAVAGFAAFATGGLTGPFAMAAPALLALATGVAVSHGYVRAAGRAGRTLIERGRIRGGLGALQAARHTGTRTVLAVLTVATALFVFAADAVGVAARNREYRAEAELGAAVVLTTSSHDLFGVRAAVADAEPTGRRATAVGLYRPPGSGAAATVAVDPQGFRAVARFPGRDVASAGWDRLRGPDTPPVTVVGSELTVTVTSSQGAGEPFGVRVDLVDAARRLLPTVLAEVDPGVAGSRTLSVPVACSRGCLLDGFSFVFGAGSPSVATRVRIARMSVDGRPVALGGRADWPDVTSDGIVDSDPTGADGTLTVSDADAGLGIALESRRAPSLTLRHASAVGDVPVLLAGAAPPDALAGRFGGFGLDGTMRPMAVVGALPFVPGSPSPAMVTDADMLTRVGVGPSDEDEVQVWLADPDPRLRTAVAAALRKQGIDVVSTRSLDEARRALGESAATWSLGLGVVTGIAALVLGLLVIALVVVTTWRQRSRDGAALLMAGVTRRRLGAALGAEQVPVVVVAVAAGVVCGVAGARYSLPSIPLFATPPVFDTLDTSTDWPATAAAAAVALAAPLGAAWLGTRWLVGRTRLRRLRETR